VEAAGRVVKINRCATHQSSLLARADTFLYAAEHQGRDRVCADPGTPVPKSLLLAWRHAFGPTRGFR